jgi:hypothetical protein
MLRRSYFILCLFIAAGTLLRAASDSRLEGGFRRANANGWMFVHLQGTPAAIGYQHGYLLAREIEDNQQAIALSITHGTGRSWEQLRELGRNLFWPRIPGEYRDELRGIAEGLKAQGGTLTTDDLVAMNGFMEYDYYFNELKRHIGEPTNSVAEHCSAFMATGTYTKDGRIVAGHNNWTDYLTAARWNVIFDIVPSAGHHLIMDGMPGLIHSGDDFGINDAGIMITETTISSFHGFNENGVPEFVRARRAMQYSESIDDFARIMKDGNNGGYANTWLVGDRKTGEIGRLELGLKNVTLERTKNGYFVGSNFPINPKLIQEETDYPVNDPNAPNTVRHRRWDQLMSEYKGRIDISAAQKFETDHYDPVTKEIDPNERTICGHIDRSQRGIPGWQEAFAPAGVAQAKVTDSNMAAHLSFVAGMGHPCGVEFHAKDHLKAHPDYSWQEPLLKDLQANRWTLVESTSSRTDAGKTGLSPFEMGAVSGATH